MKFLSSFCHRFYRFNAPLALLLTMLQRTPAVRVAAVAAEYVAASPIAVLLRAGFTAASLGAVHSLAGATSLLVTPVATANSATVGTAKTFTFTINGAQAAAGSWTVGDTVPGMKWTGSNGVAPNASGIINASTILLSGTPTEAGSYTLGVIAWYQANGSGDSLGYNHTIVVTGGSSGGGGTGGGTTNVAPAFTTQPVTQSAIVGGSVTFTVAASGTPAPIFQWQKNSVAIAGATGAAYTINNAATTDAGSYTVTATNSVGVVTSAAAVLTVVNATDLPSVTIQPQNLNVSFGSTIALNVAGSKATSYQWRKNGTAIAGATSDTLVLSGASSATAGAYTALLVNAAGSTSSNTATVTVSGGSSQISNLSVRTNLAAAQTLTVGFVANGPKSLLIRAVGPTMGTVFGFPTAYSDPKIALYSTSTQIDANDNWAASLSPVFASLGAFPLDTGSKDAALSKTVTGPNTAQINGTGSGTLLVEVYDQDGSSAVRLTNVSARNQVGTGSDVLVSGFVIAGSVAKTVLVRALGPTLKNDFGIADAIVDPKLEVYTQAGVKAAENDNWTATSGNFFGQVGAYGLVAGTKDAALILTLPPGAYTAQVSGVNNGTGNGLVEVYEVP